MRVENAISEIIMLVLGLTIGSASALLVTTSGVGLGPGEPSHLSAIMTLDHVLSPEIVTPEHDSNNKEAELDNTSPHGRQQAYHGVSSATPQTHSKQSVRTNMLMLAVIVAGGGRSSSGSP